MRLNNLIGFYFSIPKNNYRAMKLENKLNQEFQDYFKRNETKYEILDMKAGK